MEFVSIFLFKHIFFSYRNRKDQIARFAMINSQIVGTHYLSLSLRLDVAWEGALMAKNFPWYAL